MRSLATLIVTVVLFVVALYGGRAAIKAWAGSSAARGPAGSTSTSPGEDDGAPVSHESSAPKSPGRGANAHIPRVTTNAHDNAMARNGVVQSHDLLPVWERGQQLKGGMQCSTNDPKLSDLTITGIAKAAFQLPGSNANISSTVYVFRNDGEAHAFFERMATKAALGCMRRSITANLRTAQPPERVVSARTVGDLRIPGESVAYTVAIRNESTKGVWPVDAVVFRTFRAIGIVLFQNVANDKLNLVNSLDGRLTIAAH